MRARFSALIEGALVALYERRTGRHPFGFQGTKPLPPAAVCDAAAARLLALLKMFLWLTDRVRRNEFRTYPNRKPPEKRTFPGLGAGPQAGSGEVAKPERKDEPASLVPRHFGWLCEMIGGVQRRDLGLYLASEDAAAVIRRAPQFARILRPLCRAFALVIPDGLLPPRRPRRSRAKPASEHKKRERRPRSHREPERFSEAWYRYHGIVVSPQERDRLMRAGAVAGDAAAYRRRSRGGPGGA